MNNINYEAVVNHIAGKARNEFERRRNKAEYDKMLVHIHEITNTPIYRPKADEHFPFVKR